MNKFKNSLAVGVAFGALITASHGFAANAPPAANALEEVVVTARRTNENLQNVPVAVTVVQAAEFGRRGTFEPTDLAYMSPGLTVTPATGERAQVYYNIRGQSYEFGTNFPAVITYFDEVPVGLLSAGNFFDLQNIQILRGPQGVLFGRVTDGGNVMVSTHKPTNTYEGYVQGKLGNYNLREVEGMVNVPIVKDKVLFRAALDVARRDGFTKSVVTGRDYDSVAYDTYRVSLTLKPTDTIQNDTVVNYQRTFDHGTGVLPAGVNPVPLTRTANGLIGLFPGVYGIDPYGLVKPMAPGLTPLTAASYVASMQAEVARQQAIGIRKSYSEFNAWDKRDNFYLINTTTADLTPDIQAKLIVGMIDGVEDQASNYGGSNGSGFLTCHSNCGDNSDLPFVSVRQYSGEFRLAGKSLEKKLSWSLGTYWDLQEPLGESQNNDITIGVLRRVGVFYSKTRSAAGYGYFEYDASDFAQGLKFNGGLRYTHDSIHANSVVYLAPLAAPLLVPTLTAFYQNVLGLAPAAAAAAAVGNTAPLPYGQCVTYGKGTLLNGPNGTDCLDYRQSTNVWTYTAGASYQTSAGQLLYAKISRGYRAAGVNSASGPGISPVYQPEYNRSIEVGLKAEWNLNGVAARTNISAYYDKFSSIQKSTAGVTETGTAFSSIRNIAQATIKGVEFEGSLTPATGVTLGATFAYTDAQYRKDNTLIGKAGDPCNPALAQNIGFCTYNMFAYTPKFQGSVSLQYTLPVDENLGVISVGGRYYAQSKEALYSQSRLNPLSVEPSYGLIDLNAEWKSVMRSPVDLSAFITNVANKDYRVGAQELSQTSSTGIRSDIWGQPRMFGVGLKYHFGS